jgi:hypothetical protein
MSFLTGYEVLLGVGHPSLVGKGADRGFARPLPCLGHGNERAGGRGRDGALIGAGAGLPQETLPALVHSDAEAMRIRKR